MSDNKEKMFESTRKGVCPECGAKLVEYKSKTSVGKQCPQCDFAVVRSWCPLDNYPNEYKITICKPSIMDLAKYKAFAMFSGLNYLQLKKASIGKKFSNNFNIYDAWKMIEFLDAHNVVHTEDPKYPFSSLNEMKEKLMLDNF